MLPALDSIRQAFSVLRLRPFDVSTEEGRARERHRRIALSTAAAAAAKAIGVLTQLVAVPLTVHYLGPERYGLWMTISAAIATLTFADLGLGNGLMNAIATAHGRDDRAMAREYVSSALAILVGVAVVLAIAFALIYPLLPWPRLFNVTSADASAESGPAVAVAFLAFAAALPLTLVQRVQMGYQEGFAASLWQGAGNITGFLALLLAIHYHGGLAWLIAAMAGTPLLVSLLNGLVVFVVQKPWLCPDPRSVTAKAAKATLGLGLLFVALQLSMAIGFTTDNLVAAHVLGPSAVADLSVASRLFGIAPALLAMALIPMWPAYGEALARGDYSWVRRTLNRSLLLSLTLTAVPSLMLVVVGQQVIALWVGPSVSPSIGLLAGLAVWTVLSALGSTTAMLLNAANVVRFQVVCSLLMAVAALGAKIWLANQVGLAGIPWGTSLAYVVLLLVPVAFFVPRFLAKLGRSAVTAELPHDGR